MILESAVNTTYEFWTECFERCQKYTIKTNYVYCVYHHTTGSMDKPLLSEPRMRQWIALLSPHCLSIIAQNVCLVDAANALFWSCCRKSTMQQTIWLSWVEQKLYPSATYLIIQLSQESAIKWRCSGFHQCCWWCATQSLSPKINKINEKL